LVCGWRFARGQADPLAGRSNLKRKRSVQIGRVSSKQRKELEVEGRLKNWNPFGEALDSVYEARAGD